MSVFAGGGPLLEPPELGLLEQPLGTDRDARKGSKCG
jgi:hypothetical protein